MSFGPQNLGQLAQALAASADALAAIVQANIAFMPDGPALATAVGQQARAAHVFRDTIDANQPLQVVAQAFSPVDALANQIGQYLAGNPVPPQVKAAWDSFASVEAQIPPSLGLGLGPAQPGIPPVTPFPTPGPGASAVLGLTEQLLQETGAFLAVFGPTAGKVPEGRFMFAEAQQLQASAANFRQAILGGLPPDRLSYEFANVGACWERLGQRVNRIAQGRMGPNIAQVQKLGALCAQISQVLSPPGFGPGPAGPYR